MEETSAPPNILLIEDDSVFRMLVKRLVGDDFNIEEASSLEAAKQLLASQRFDCVLLDYRLPDGTGLQLLPDAIVLDLPVVMMTAMGHEQLAVDAIKQGCQDYLIKDDLTRASLCRSLANAMRHVRADRQAMRQRISLQKIVEAAAVKCREATTALRNSGGNDEEGNAIREPHLDKLDHLMDGLTAYARLTSMSWTPETLSLVEVAQEAMHDLQPVLANSSVELSHQTTPTFKSDRDAVKFICRGLLEFVGSDGAPSVALHAQTESDKGHISIAFAPKSQDAKALDAQLSSRGSFNGSLSADTGLEVVRLLVEQLQGQIWTEDQEDRVQIRVTLPNGNQLDALKFESFGTSPSIRL